MAVIENAILVNGKNVEVNNVQYDITLLNWLRDYNRLTGTKEGCAEGDCGACSVIIEENGSSNLKPINSCLVRLGQVIGASVTTIEGLGCDKNPHSLQIAFYQTSSCDTISARCSMSFMTSFRCKIS